MLEARSIGVHFLISCSKNKRPVRKRESVGRVGHADPVTFQKRTTTNCRLPVSARGSMHAYVGIMHHDFFLGRSAYL